MRQYCTKLKKTEELEKIICNKCGKEILVCGGVPQEDVLEVDHVDLCEDCYDELVSGFRIQIED